MKKILVVGAGPCGLMASYQIKKNNPSYRVILLDKDEFGKRIKVSGNGRCNFSNINVSEDKYYNGELIKDIIDDFKINQDKFYQEIINIFSLAEIYTDIFMLDKRDFPIYHQTFDLDNVGASVDYNNFGNVSSYIIYDGKICSNNEIKDIKNDILKRIPVYTDNLDVISSYIVNEQRKAKIRKKEY